MFHVVSSITAAMLGILRISSPRIIPLKGHPSAGAECAGVEVEINCAQGEAHLDQGSSSNFARDLRSGKHTRWQVLQGTDQHFWMKVERP